MNASMPLCYHCRFWQQHDRNFYGDTDPGWGVCAAAGDGSLDMRDGKHSIVAINCYEDGSNVHVKSTFGCILHEERGDE